MDYPSYIASHRWRQNPARLAELEASGFRCRVCNDDGTGSALEVHHRTYANLFNEQVGDLTALCRTCHRIVTDHLRRVRFGQCQPAHANIRTALDNPSSLFDPTAKEAI
jgi:5-methylcytosine-specific restriction endonuclease McrA